MPQTRPLSQQFGYLFSASLKSPPEILGQHILWRNNPKTAVDQI